jgi:hypothetical protein
MQMIGDEVHLSEREASSGEQLHVMRWVLGISLLLVTGLPSAVRIHGATLR